MDISIKLAPFPWEMDGLRGSDFDGSQIGRVAAYVEATVTDTDGFAAVELVKVDAATIAKIADGTEKDPAKAVQTIVDLALADVKARVLAERAAMEAEEAAAKSAEAANAVLAGRVKAALGALGKPGIVVVGEPGTIEDLGPEG